jgi:uncharacterized repeat protein (TIGR03843 family)
VAADPTEVTQVLAEGAMEIVGRLAYSSNNAFLVLVGDPGDTSTDGEARDPEAAEDPRVLAVYKPAAGERPLGDFPPGLYRREVATRLLAEVLGWDLVPPTVLRHDGPVGEGSVQQFIDHDPDRHYFVLHAEGTYDEQLRRLAVFDLVANSADRKGGHVLADADDHIWGIDNGLTFHAQFKLRTVLWDFAGDAIPDALRADVARLLDLIETDALPAPLAGLLDPFERDALGARARAVVHADAFPHDPSGRRWPWPAV